MKHFLAKSVLFAAAAATIVGCTGKGLFNGKVFKERAAEAPVPHEQGVDKSFFVEPNGKPKTFLCAWAPEIGRGWIGERILTRLTNRAMHCNVQFEITEDYLVGKMINPSFPDKPELFKEALKIKISKHYYYERDKDQHGRDTNEWIENDRRSHWSARPRMNLDLADISILDFGVPGGFGAMKTTSIEDIEWDNERGFLGFSLNSVFTSVFGPAEEYQGRFRINFLRFEHDTTFKKVPYAQDNAKFMNILHVMGQKIDGDKAKLYAAHWDLRKPTTIYISGAPAHIQPILVSAVEKWNKTLQEIGAIGPNQKAFIPEIKELKHPFDLRYTTINWIQDKRISLTSPLGIGMAHADVRNGKILWGGVVIYGGMLETYINRYAPVDGAASGNANAMSSPLGAFSSFFPERMPPMPGLDQLNPSSRGQLLNNMVVDHRANMEKELAQMTAQRQADPEKLAALREQMEQMTKADPTLNQITGAVVQEAQKDVTDIGRYFQQVNLRRDYGAGDDAPKGSAAEEIAQSNPELAAVLSATNENRRATALDELRNAGSPFFIEEGLNVINMSAQWNQGAAQSTRPFPELLEAVVMDLTLHEIGHMIGLGHNFKENIVPHAHTVPSKYVREMSAKATAANKFTNYSTVMGYRNGRTEMEMKASELEPGPMDKLVLRYLYKGQYTTYNRATDQWHYSEVPESGVIPSRSRVQIARDEYATLPTSYFPACNDIEASLEADPFCNRWDRGSSAVDIMKSYFEYINDNLLSTLYSLVGGGGNHWMHEYYLWNSALTNFSRVRLFYDEMRRRLRSEDRLTGLWNQLRQDKDSLFEFSQACQKPDPKTQSKSAILKELFKHQDIVDLCRANALALKEYRYFLNLPEGDYTRIDHTNRYISGGYLEGDVTHNWGNMLGSWYSLSNFPLKFTAMFTLTTANPFQFNGRWLWPNIYFSHQDNRFLYRTLYPREYTQLVSDSVQNNMRFAATGMDSTTTMGRTILATSSMLPYQRWTSNDSAALPREYNEMLDQQTQFSLSMVAVIISAMKPEANSGVAADHYKKFTATIYDFFTNQSTTAREVYILPKGNVMVWANGMFLFPITQLKFYKDTSAYLIAYKISFDYQVGDQLIEDSVKSALLEKHNTIASLCVDGFNRNGLANYFNDSQAAFKGFHIPPGIAEEVDKDKTKVLYESIDNAYVDYEAWAAKEIGDFPIKKMKLICDESIRGIGQISSSAALINGYWLRITPEYLVK